MESLLDIEAVIYKYKQGSLKSYEDLVTLLNSQDTNDDMLLKTLISIKDCVTLLEPEHEHLVGAILQITRSPFKESFIVLPWSCLLPRRKHYDYNMTRAGYTSSDLSMRRGTEIWMAVCSFNLKLDWVRRGEDVLDVYKSLICCLVSVHTDYLRAVLRMIIRQFKPAKTDDLDEKKIESDREIFQHLHSLMCRIVQLVPMSPKVIMPLLIDLFPYMSKHVYIQESYLQNQFVLTQYVPQLRQQIFELIFDKLLKLDVQLPKEEILRKDDDEEESGIFEMDEGRTSIKIAHADTLDTLMIRVFQYVESCCFDQDGFNWEATKRLYREMLYVFEKIILPTHASNHVQFIMFYFCSLRTEICDGFLDFLWKLVQNPNVQAVYRQAAVSYVGSLLARGSFISIQTVMKTLELMMTWLHSYTKLASDTVLSDVTHHGPFYAVCQAVFYVFSFRQKEILNSKTGLKWAENLQFQHLIQCRLNPLKVCLPIIVKTFASVLRQHQLAFCDHIIQQNKRLELFSGNHKTLDPYFPFDPYLLEKSAVYIKSHYRDYDQSILMEESDSSDEDDEDDDDEDIFSDEKNVNISTGSVAMTPSSLIEHSVLDIMEYGTSPGFSHVKLKT